MKEDLLKKWLNNELSPKELETFKALDEYPSYVKILNKAKHFKAPEYDEKSAFEGLDFAMRSGKKSSTKVITQLIAAIAAVLIIGFLVIKYSYLVLETDAITTEVAKTEDLRLPDKSDVSLNANSSISYDSSKWKNTKELKLNGEALFKVNKGKTFTVNTDYGKVQVLGTVFNVKSRDYIFEVTCFEGSVEVNVDDGTYTLNPNDKLSFENSKITLHQSVLSAPDWKNKQSLINSKPLTYVLKEFKNYYDINFDTSNIDTSKIYTGSFSHKNLEIALNSITLPLGFTYRINGETVLLLNK